MGQTKVKLDLKDRKILSELDWNGRITNSDLARKVGLSKKAVEYRIKRLENLKVILKYYPILNFEKIGYHIRRVELSFIGLNERLRQDIERFVIDDSDFGWVIWIRGSWDLAIDIWSNSSGEFKRIFNKFNSKFGKYIKKRRFTTSSGVEHYPYSFILGKKRNEKIAFSEEIDNIMQLDDLDISILKELCRNARQSFSEIGRKLGHSYKTIIYRIKELENKGIYLGSRAFINEAIFGYSYYKIIFYFNFYSTKLYHDVREYFKKKIETVYIVDHVDSDFDVEIICESDDFLFSMIEGFNESFPGLVKDFEYWKFYKTVKVVYLPNL